MGQVAVFWWVRDNPAPQARARAQFAVVATHGTSLIVVSCNHSNNTTKKTSNTPPPDPILEVPDVDGRPLLGQSKDVSSVSYNDISKKLSITISIL